MRCGVVNAVINRVSRALILGRLANWRHSRIDFHLPDGTTETVGDRASATIDTVNVHDDKVFRRILLSGSTGAGEAYVDGHWSSPDLQGLVSRMLQARDQVTLDAYLSLPRRLFDYVRHTFRPNSRKGSSQNIHAHYDLGNEFFEVFLDDSLAYSCALWDSADDLGEAQREKYEHICQVLDLRDGDRVLEIGCGWGGFAMYAALTRKVHVVALTISPSQFDLATARVAAAGLEEHVEIVVSDYRDIDGQYDKVVSIEMFEAVGREYWDVYFEMCTKALRPGGLMFLQTIGIPDAHVKDDLRASGWISKYIFPGGVLPAVIEVREALRRGGDALVVLGSREIGLHYVRTLDEWRRRFWNGEDRVRALGFDDRFVRMWDFYLAACSGAFEAQVVRDVQLLLERRH
tara:strand:- start:15359 stop:16567 length:1209 start_codon:yes stop_codon:yes gene_type:complete